MRTLYDLLDVPSDADDEALSRAYRKAAKAHHPDLNAGDPDAPHRFRRIAAAIEILRDAEQRAAYDRLLDWERQQRRLKRTRIIIAEAIAAAVLIVVLVGGYALIGRISTSTMMSKSENGAAPGPIAMAAEQPAQRTEPTGGAEREATPGREQEERGQAPEFGRQIAERAAALGLEQGERGQAADREQQTAEREATLGHGQEERPRAAGRERQTAEREAPPKREQDERRREHKAKQSTVIAEAVRSATPTRSQPVEEAQIASSAASPRSFGPAEIAATRAFTRF